MKFYYSHGRTAFKYGLINLGIKKNDQILMPEYLCDVLIDPLEDLGIKPNFYKINKDFTTDWKNLNKKAKGKIKALLFINYFGYEENKKKFKDFCKKRKIFLIEDNCHSLKFNDDKKNEFSDFTFYSTKKIIKNSFTGGILKIKKKSIKKPNVIKLNKYKINVYEAINHFLENNFFIIKQFLKYFFLKRPNYEKIDDIKNKKLTNDFLMDDYSKKILLKRSFQNIKTIRLKNLNVWKKICLRNKSIVQIKRQLNKNTIPWLYPVYVDDNKLRKKIFLFGWKNGYSIISWPSLPKELINSRNKRLWSKLVCFDTDKAPQDYKTINFS